MDLGEYPENTKTFCSEYFTNGDRYPHFSYPHNQGGTKWLM